MQLVTGGAFSGKRKLVKDMHKTCSWLSSYEGDVLSEWNDRWKIDSTLVLEGFEKWIARELKHKESCDIRKEFQTFFQILRVEEQKRNNEIILIMLEIGKGIVPIQEEERKIRDLIGWVTQDAAKVADEVNYLWNGLSKRLK